jgi:2-oxoglutarate dehydrogenase E2 component (dihydrolipoamide succinyltransferase)
MKENILVPSVGESVTQGTLAAWLKREGDSVEEGEELFELETDKATVAVPAPASGILRIQVPAGSEVEIGAVVGVLETPQKAGIAGAPAAAPQDLPPVSPLARQVIAEHGLDASRIAGTGPGGRITREDALRAAAKPAIGGAPPRGGSTTQIAGSTAQAAPVTPQIAGSAAPAAAPPRAGSTAEAAGPAPGRDPTRETREPMTRLRRALTERLVAARQQTALTTTYNEVDMGAVQELRRRYGEEFEKRQGVRLGLMSFFVKAACRALQALPVVNSRIEGSEIVTCRYYDIGVAVSMERGLVVPVLRDADTLGFAEIEKRIAELAQRARDRRLGPEELAGGTFTITNGGVFGSLLSAPLPNYPQAAILGMHAIQRRPVAREEQVVIRPMMYLALSYDHRLIDGREAVQFLVKIKQLVEEPERLLLEQ